VDIDELDKVLLITQADFPASASGGTPEIQENN
jgi:hypothetical protein